MNQNINFHKPLSPEAASKILSEIPKAIPLAGGTDLIVKFRNGILPEVTDFVDLTGLKLNRIIVHNEQIEIQSCCTMSQVIEHPVIQEFFPALVSAAKTVGAIQIRNSATLGGNSGNASPAGDTIPALYSLNAEVLIYGKTGERKVKIDDFFKGPGKTSLESGEFIKAFLLNKKKTSGAFIKLGERRAHAISKINVAISRIEEGSEKGSCRIAFGSVAPTILRCPEAESFLKSANFPLSRESLEKLAAIGRQTARPIDDVRSTRRYRKQMAGVLLKRAIQKIYS